MLYLPIIQSATVNQLNLLLMKKNYFFSLLAGLAAVLPATAAGTDDGYRPMIRQDRTWEYLQTRREMKGTAPGFDNHNTLFRMKFDGSEVKNGKEYSRFVYCGDRSSWTSTIDYNTGTTISTDTVTVPNDNTTVFYLREEPGKVFVLFPYDESRYFDEANYKAVKGEEVLLYDFTLKDGESFTGFWSSGDFMGGLIDYPVRALDPVKVAGEECRVFGMTKDFHGACDGYRFAEEAGCLNYGTLAAPDAVLRTTGLTTTDIHLQKMYDADGNVIYDSSQYAKEDPLAMINEDRTWIYRKQMLGPMVDYEMSFTDSRKLNGHTYHKFALTKKTVYDDDGNVSSEETFENGSGYWLREFTECWKVWLLTDGTKPVEDISVTDHSKLQDFLIYDFSLIEGSEFKCVMYPDDFSESGCVTVTMNDAEPMEIDGQRCRVQIPEGSQSISGLSFIQGIGTTCNGSLATPYVGGISGPLSDQSLPSLLSVLLAVKDKDGKIIYKNNSFGGIDSLNSGNESSRSDAPIYDILGRRVTSMTRGGVYIRDGKKFVNLGQH